MIVQTVSVKLPEPNKKEILRYAKAGNDAGLPLDECICELGVRTGRAAYAYYDILPDGDELDLGFAKTKSADLKKALAGCDKILVFAATVGLQPDRMIAKYNRISGAKALLMQAIGAERAESLCDVFCASISDALKKDGYILRPRFSPGYGDLPLALQKDLLAALDAGKLLGITLNDSLLMMPTKSVTAIAGIKKSEPSFARRDGD